MRKNFLIISFSWLLVILWMIAIFWLSSMDTNESNGKSMKTINKVIESTVDTTNKIGITDKHPSTEKKAQVTEKLNIPLRKFMHASVYLVLAILVMNALIVSGCKYLVSLILCLIICFGYACSDEYHQTFVDGRTGQFSDVLIDTGGSVIGNCLYGIGYLIYKKIKKED